MTSNTSPRKTASIEPDSAVTSSPATATNDLPERLARLCWIAVGLLLAAVLLSACGPGSGGTGTGPLPSRFFSSSPAAAGQAQAQACDCGRVDIEFTPARVQLTTRCGSFAYEGPWATDPSGRTLLGGQFQTAAGASVPATMELQFEGEPADSPRVGVTVRDAAGAVLVGPTTLERQASLAPRMDSGNCP